MLAAVDLGSNSFHMLVARLTHGQLTVIDRLREMVRLAAGLDAGNRLDDASRARALECLSRFGERIRDMQAGQVRVVGTNTLRKARGVDRFLEEAETLLGHPVEIISGIEEARLIYLGVSHSLPSIAGEQICVDIGGGSTEIIRGKGYEPKQMESLYLGCVSLSTQYFPSGKLSARKFEKARLAARLELEPVKARFVDPPVDRFIGASGTIRAAATVGQQLGLWSEGITCEGLERLVARMVDAGRVERLELPGLSEQRRPVFPGGVAILAEVLDALNIDCMQVADGALREGILYDLLGRLTDEDARVRTVRAMEARFHVDTAQAARVEATAMRLFDQVVDDWKLTGDENRLALGWAARLHEVGLDIAHSQYHRHGAYLLENADMPGFTREEQRVLARLVGTHRRSFSRSAFDDLPRRRARAVLRMAVLLRLAVLLNRSRTDTEPAPLRVRVEGKRIGVSAPVGWLTANPLTRAGLEAEHDYLAQAGLDMQLEPFG